MTKHAPVASGPGIRSHLIAIRQNLDVANPRRRAPLAIGLGFVAVVAASFIIGPNVASVFADDAGMMQFLVNEGAKKRRPAAAAQQPAARGFAPMPYAAMRTQSFFPLERLKANSNTHIKRKAVAAKKSEQRWRTPVDFASLSFTPGVGASTLGKRSVCVRLCDGFYFPIGAVNNHGDVEGHDALCSSLCPGAPTKLFVVPSGSEKMEDAIAVRDSKPYTALPVAFRHTGTADKTCACRGADQPHARLVSLLKDFTLRSGDSVMTDKGFRVFKGSENWPYKQRDFVRLANSSELTKEKKGALSVIERATGHATPRPAKVSPASNKLGALELPQDAPVPGIGPFKAYRGVDGREVRKVGPQALLLP